MKCCSISNNYSVHTRFMYMHRLHVSKITYLNSPSQTIISIELNAPLLPIKT